MTSLEPTFYDFTSLTLEGETYPLASCKGQVVLVVNVASRCGYTPQYRGLEELYREYRARGLVVLGFPCNQFGRQERGTADEIRAFCTKEYGVSFPLFGRIDVNGPHEHPLYRFLKSSQPGMLGLADIKWNFTKFLVDRGGRVVRRFAPWRSPESIRPELERLL
jgi:glutathione peroxidase